MPLQSVVVLFRDVTIQGVIAELLLGIEMLLLGAAPAIRYPSIQRELYLNRKG
jgi:hypothetical protein